MALLFIFSLNRAFQVLFYFMINSHVSPSDPLFKTSFTLTLWMGCKSSFLAWKLCQEAPMPASSMPSTVSGALSILMDHPSSITLLPLIQLYLSFPVWRATKGPSAQDASWPTLLGACSQSYPREASSTYTGRCAVSIRRASSE